MVNVLFALILTVFYVMLLELLVSLASTLSTQLMESLDSALPLNAVSKIVHLVE